MPVIGFMNAASAKGYGRHLSAYLKGLGKTGYVDGQNVAIEYRWAEGAKTIGCRRWRYEGKCADLMQGPYRFGCILHTCRILS
jgi:hypothetical protein